MPPDALVVFFQGHESKRRSRRRLLPSSNTCLSKLLVLSPLCTPLLLHLLLLAHWNFEFKIQTAGVYSTYHVSLYFLHGVSLQSRLASCHLHLRGLDYMLRDLNSRQHASVECSTLRQVS